ncbi:lipocalin family protein [Imperialibacter roseus]|uniref:Lipocalin-like domain-containing protein n=1 Tax=Imperialibacter roseus TaxID=1324217 RepID=A0ABZ0IJE5_9BACT|nr:lipocalin family protein [Imperialibacter roseus]WOK05143.1 hypothetical protein RT717_18840 [Imperialibacter roseus]|tara:strand:+ start:48761 stop:49258 length:498 start_codon:yes stop_codon:yes gene_type:complete
MRRFTKILFLPFVVLTLLAACGGKDDEGVSSPLIGTWKYSSVDVIELSINGQDVVAYLIAEFELSEAEAQEIADGFSINAEEESDITNVTIEFKADNTYVSSQPGEDSETGTWSLSSDGKMLTVDDQTFEVQTLTSSKLVGRISQQESTEVGTMKIVIEFSFTKS